jgi:hypothetical protein
MSVYVCVCIHGMPNFFGTADFCRNTQNKVNILLNALTFVSDSFIGLCCSKSVFVFTFVNIRFRSCIGGGGGMRAETPLSEQAAAINVASCLCSGGVVFICISGHRLFC